MIDFFKNILPRVLSFSKELDEKEIFVDKPWIFIDESNNHHEYIFMRDGRLVMSLNGIVTIGNWELMPNKKLMINRVTDTIMLQKMFVNDALLLLQKSGTSEIPFTLINEKVIPDLNAVSYLEGLNKRRLPTEERSFKVMIREDGIADSIDKICIGDKVGNENNDIITGVFKTNKINVQEYIEVNKGEVVKIFYKVRYTYNEHEFSIIQKTIFGAQKDDFIDIYDPSIFPVNRSIEVTDTNGYKISVYLDNKGHVTKIDYRSVEFYIAISALILLFVLIAIINARSS